MTYRIHFGDLPCDLTAEDEVVLCLTTKLPAAIARFLKSLAKIFENVGLAGPAKKLGRMGPNQLTRRRIKSTVLKEMEIAVTSQ